MASKAAVVTGTLPTSGTVNLTSSGFGTVDAAIVFLSNANTSGNPQSGNTISIGFWDGVNSAQYCASTVSFDNFGTSSSDRYRSTSHIARSGSGYTAAASATTDGITLTVSGSTGVQRYVTAILIGGATDVHLEEENLGTSTSPQDITAPAFKPDIVFFGCVGLPSSLSSSDHAILSFGAAHNSSSDVISQAGVYTTAEDGAGTSNTDSYTTDSYIGSQFFNGAVSWQASVSDFDANGFTLTTTANGGSDRLGYLAIKLADPDDAWVDIINAATSTGNSAHTGTGFTPDAVGLVAANATSLDTVTSGSVFMMGAGDSTSEQALTSFDEDAQASTDTGSKADTGKILQLLNDDGTTDAEATLGSLDSDGFTLNYSDAAGAATKILAFAIGDSTAGGGGTSVPVFHRYYSQMRMR